MDIAPSLNQRSERCPETILKRLIAQPLNGSSIISLSSGASTQTRVEIPACVQRPDLIEIGYQMTLNAANGVAAPLIYTAANNKYGYFLPATYLPEWDKIEIFHANSTNKLCEITNFPKYSKMTSSLFNDFRKRNLSDRVNFKKDNGSSAIGKSKDGTITYSFNNSTTTYTTTAPTNTTFATVATTTNNAAVQIPPQGVIGNNIINAQQPVNYSQYGTAVFDGYLNDQYSTAGAQIMIPPSSDNQQEYLPMGYFVPINAGNTTDTAYQPYTYNFNFRLGDVIHDSFLNNMKHHYHSSNMVIVIYWSPVSAILGEMTFTIQNADNFAGNVANNNNNAFTTGPNKASALRQIANLGTTPLCIQNFFVRYYVEQNPLTVELIKNMEYEIIYPFINQSNMALTAGAGGQIAANLMLGNEGDSRLYRVYTALFGSVSATNRFLGDNSSNIGYDVKNGVVNQSQYYGKWAGNHELYFDNDLYERITSQYGDWQQTMKQFQESSLNTKSELEYIGTIAYNFDSSYLNGRKDEYANNILRGKVMDKQTNINPRFLSVQTDGGDNLQGNYTCYIFAVTLRKGIIKKGEFYLI